MSLFSHVRSFWRNTMQRGQVETDLDHELHAYVELMAAEKIESGQPHDQALREARLELGNMNSIKEGVRASRAGHSIDSLARNVRHAVRALSRRPAFVAVAVVSLSIGIGAATAVYSWGSFMFFRPPAGIADPKTLVAIFLDDRDPETEPNIISLPHFEELRSGQAVLSDMAGAFRYWASLSTGERAQEVSVEFVTGTFFNTIGTSMFIGRGIHPADDVPGGPLSAVLSYDLWREAFGSASNILGRTLRLNGHLLTIVGVAPAAFEGVDYSFYGKPQVWTATHAYTPIVGTNRVTRRSALLRVVGRLEPGVTIDAAEAALNVPAARLSYEPTDFRQYVSAHVVPIHEARIPIYTRASIRRAFGVLLLVTGLVLMAACLNVANFLISNSITRRAEMGLRIALGATRRQVFQQLLTESCLLGAAAGVGGLLFAFVLARFLQVPAAINVGTALETPVIIDLKAGLFAWMVTLVATFSFGLLPALLASYHSPIVGAFGAATRSTTGHGFRTRQFLLALQTAFALMLIVVGSLHAKSLLKIESVVHPYPTEQVLVARINATSLPVERRAPFYRELLRQLRAHGAVSGASVSSTALLSPGGAGVQAAAGAPDIRADYVTAGPGYFGGLDVPLRAGREFRDEGEQDGAIIINTTLARQLWRSESAIGRSVRLPGFGPKDQAYTVVGVVDQPRCRDMSAVFPCVYLPVRLNGASALYLYLRTNVRPASLVPELHATVNAMGPDVVVDQTRTLGEHIGLLRTGPRLAASMTVGTALLATLLCAIGCTALLMSFVRESHQEIAIRLALGSSSRRLTQHVTLRAVLPCALGLVVGLYGAWLAAGHIGEQLYETSVHELDAFALPAVLLLAVAIAASYFPVRIATRTNPGVLLRES